MNDLLKVCAILIAFVSPGIIGLKINLLFIDNACLFVCLFVLCLHQSHIRQWKPTYCSSINVMRLFSFMACCFWLVGAHTSQTVVTSAVLKVALL